MKIRIGLLGVLLVLVIGAPGVASAKDKAKSILSEGEWIAYDAGAKVVKVRITDPGKGRLAKKLKRGREAEFKVKPEGSVLTRTTVAIQGRKSELTEIEEGRTVNVYWRPDEADPKARFARKIDVVMSLEEFTEKYGGE